MLVVPELVGFLCASVTQVCIRSRNEFISLISSQEVTKEACIIELLPSNDGQLDAFGLKLKNWFWMFSSQT